MTQKNFKQSDKDKQAGVILAMHMETQLASRGFGMESIKFLNRGYEWLVVLSVTDEGGRWHAVFHTGEDAASALRGLYQKVSSDKADYRVDKWKQKENGENP